MPRKQNLGPKVAAKRLDAAEAVAKACRLRREGKHIREIAAELGRSIGWVSEEINRAIREFPKEDAAALREHLLSREEALIATHWPNRHDPDSAKVIHASDKIIADIAGLYAPTKTELTGKDGGPVLVTDARDELLARLTGLADRVAPPRGEGGGGSEPEPGGG